MRSRYWMIVFDNSAPIPFSFKSARLFSAFPHIAGSLLRRFPFACDSSHTQTKLTTVNGIAYSRRIMDEKIFTVKDWSADGARQMRGTQPARRRKALLK